MVQVVESKMVKQKWKLTTHCVLYCNAVKNDSGLFFFLQDTDDALPGCVILGEYEVLGECC